MRNVKKYIVSVMLLSYVLYAQSNQRLWDSANSGAVGGIGYFKGLNGNVQNDEGQTPLMIAVKNGYTDVVRSFEDAIVDVWQEDYSGKTAFDYIKQPTNKDEILYSKRLYGALRTVEVQQIIISKAKIVQYSYEHDKDMLSITIKGAKCDDFLFPKNTKCHALPTPSNHPIFQAIKDKNNTAFEQSLADLNDMSIRNKSKYTPLWASIHYHNLYALERLLEVGADMYELDQNGLKTPLYWATMINDTKVLKILLKHGADVNSKNLFGDVALYTARSNCDNFEAIEILLDNGADPYQKNKRGKIVFDRDTHMSCKKENSIKMKALLKSRSAF